MGEHSMLYKILVRIPGGKFRIVGRNIDARVSLILKPTLQKICGWIL
jgi:hypothetical protein